MREKQLIPGDDRRSTRNGIRRPIRAPCTRAKKHCNGTAVLRRAGGLGAIGNLLVAAPRANREPVRFDPLFDESLTHSLRPGLRKPDVRVDGKGPIVGVPLDRRREVRSKLDEAGLCLEHSARPATKLGASGTEEDPVTGLRNELLFYGRGNFGAPAAIRLSGSLRSAEFWTFRDRPRARRLAIPHRCSWPALRNSTPGCTPVKIGEVSTCLFGECAVRRLGNESFEEALCVRVAASIQGRQSVFEKIQRSAFGRGRRRR